MTVLLTPYLSLPLLPWCCDSDNNRFDHPLSPSYVELAIALACKDFLW